MTVTTAEILSVDGVVLNTLANNIETLAGRLQTPPLRGSNVLVPSRNGAVYTRTKSYDQGQIVLPMWVAPCDEDGQIPFFGTPREEFYKNLDRLTKLFRPRKRLLDVRHTLPDGSVRQAYGEILDAIDFSAKGVNPIAKFSVVLNIPAAFWQDVSPVSSSKPLTATGQEVPLNEFGGATAPMEDLVYEIVGPVTNPKLSAMEDGELSDPEISMQYNGVIADGQSLQVDCGTWDLVGTGGLVVDYTKFVHLGSSRFMVLNPEESPSLQFTGSGLGANTALNVTGRRKFLLG